jgi:hypothetical protein
VCLRTKPVCRNGHRNSHGITAPLNAHHLAPALEAHRPARIDVFQYEGKLDDLPKGKGAVRLKEHSRNTEVTRDARPFR